MEVLQNKVKVILIVINFILIIALLTSDMCILMSSTDTLDGAIFSAVENEGMNTGLLVGS
jgi:hypothetical protein